jgi:hypothetical protein
MTYALRATVMASLYVLKNEKKKLILSVLLIVPAILYSTPSKEEVLEAIKQVKTDLINSETFDNGKVILEYAEESDDVLIVLTKERIPWTVEDWEVEKSMEETLKNLILVSYLSGNIESQIKNNIPSDDPYSGWIFVIGSYEKLKENIEFKSESIEEFDHMRKSGELMSYSRLIKKN